MNRVHLLPRLSPIGVKNFLSRTEFNAVDDANEIKECAEFLSYGASGGSVDDTLALEIARGLRKIAVEKGFPDTGSTKARSSFDYDGAIFLAEEQKLRCGEAFRDDVWACLATLLAPDVVSWRFPDLSAERFQGGVRNTFQRLWVRGVSLDRGADHEDRWGLIEALTEDALVQIFERPSLAGSSLLARAVAESWAAIASIYGRSSMENIMRSAIKLIRLRNEIVDLGILDYDGVAEEVMEIFKRAAEWNQVEPHSETGS